LTRVLDEADWLPLDYRPLQFEEAEEDYEKRKRKKDWEKLSLKEKERVKIYSCKKKMSVARIQDSLNFF
jgi:hypothetical protein